MLMVKIFHHDDGTITTTHTTNTTTAPPPTLAPRRRPPRCHRCLYHHRRLHHHHHPHHYPLPNTAAHTNRAQPARFPTFIHPFVSPSCSINDCYLLISTTKLPSFNVSPFPPPLHFSVKYYYC